MNRLSGSLASALAVVLALGLAQPVQAAANPVVPITVPGSASPVMGVLDGLPPLTQAPGTDYEAGPALAEVIELYRATGQYQRAQSAVAGAARRYLSAWIRENCTKVRDCDGRRAAAVFDIDDTLLDWYPTYQSVGFTYDTAVLSNASINCLTPVIAPTVALLKWAQRRGVAVFLITGRPIADQALLTSCLTTRGITGWDGLTMRQPDQETLTAAVYKSRSRAAIEAKGYRIITSVGDQLSDMMYGHLKMGFRLPNPMYYIP